jgi:hypothetical protein
MGMLVIGKDWGVFQYKKKQHDLGKDKNPITQGQVDTGFAYQGDKECS